MALAVTLLGSATFTTASGTKTVVATPAVGDLIVIVTAHSGNTSAATPTDDNSSGAYTSINSALKATSADRMGIFVRNALIGAASSTTFSHAPGTSSGGGLAVFKVTGMQKVGSAAARQSAKQENIASGTPTPVLSQAALATNALIGALFNAASPAGMTPRGTPAWTERNDSGYSTPTSGLETMSINSGETATSIAWGSSSASAFCSLVMELNANQDLTAGLHSNSQSFPAPVLTSVYGLTPGLLAGVQSFFATTVSQTAPSQSLTPSLFSDGDTFHAATVAAGAVALAPGLVGNSQSFPSPAVSATKALTASLVNPGQTFFGPAISGSISLAPALVPSSGAFYSATAAPGLVPLSPALLPSANGFHGPTVAAGPVGLSPPVLASGNAFFGATVANEGQPATLAPSLVSNDAAFHAPSVEPSNSVSAPVVANDNSFSPVSVSGVSAVLVPLVANDNQFFEASVGSSYQQELTADCFANASRVRRPYVRRVGDPLVKPSYPLAGMARSYPLRRAG